MNTTKQKIVLTGAPSSGKTTLMTRLTEVLGNEVVIVPESAVVLLSGGMPAPSHNDIDQIRAFQKAIISTQAALELLFEKKNPNKNLMVFDRCMLDGAGFWPLGSTDFFAEFKIDIAQEFAKFNTVLFLELPSEKFFGGINRLRFHDYQQCLKSEKQLKEIYRHHPHFIEIKATENVEDKIQAAVSVIKKLSPKLSTS